MSTEKTRAHTQVNLAKYRGDLVRPGWCENCGRDDFADSLIGHHEDYSKPLEVEWLCRACHALRHARPRRSVPVPTGRIPGMVTLDEAGHRYGVSPMMLRALRSRRLLTPHRDPRSARVFYSLVELDKLFERGRFMQSQLSRS